MARSRWLWRCAICGGSLSIHRTGIARAALRDDCGRDAASFNDDGGFDIAMARIAPAGVGSILPDGRRRRSGRRFHLGLRDILLNDRRRRFRRRDRLGSGGGRIGRQDLNGLGRDGYGHRFRRRYCARTIVLGLVKQLRNRRHRRIVNDGPPLRNLRRKLFRRMLSARVSGDIDGQHSRATRGQQAICDLLAGTALRHSSSV